MFKIHHCDFRNEVIKEEKLVIVDFSAAWCMPCKMIAPILEQIDNENDKIKVVNIDVDVNPYLSQCYNIKTIPNIKLFKNGVIVDEIIGFAPKNEIEEVIKRNL